MLGVSVSVAGALLVVGVLRAADGCLDLQGISEDDAGNYVMYLGPVGGGGMILGGPDMFNVCKTRNTDNSCRGCAIYWVPSTSFRGSSEIQVALPPCHHVVL